MDQRPTGRIFLPTTARFACALACFTGLPQASAAELLLDFAAGFQAGRSTVKIYADGTVEHTEMACCPPKTRSVAEPKLSAAEIGKLQALIESAITGAAVTRAKVQAPLGFRTGWLKVYDAGAETILRNLDRANTQYASMVFVKGASAALIDQTVARYAKEKLNFENALKMGITRRSFMASAQAESKTGFEGVAWKTGQVLATSEMASDPTTFFFEVGTGSRYGHVGIVAAPDTGATLDNTFVYEETPPAARKTPLREFLERTSRNAKGAVEATLLEPEKPLTTAETQTLLRGMDEIVSKQVPYNYTAVADSAALNCSEFVRKSFASLGREVGAVERFSDMDVQAFGGKLFPLFGEGVDPDAFVVTPVSIVHSSGLKVVTAHLPVGTFLSEAEIFAAWKKSGALDALSDLAGIPLKNLTAMEGLAATKPYRAFPSGWRVDCAGFLKKD